MESTTPGFSPWISSLLLLGCWVAFNDVARAGPAADRTGETHVTDLDRMCDLAQFVVVGRVSHVVALWTQDRSEIFTYVTLQASRDMKGGWRAGRDLTFRVRGGRVGNVTSVVFGAPVFSVREHVVVFLTTPDPDGFPRVLGQQRGVWRIRGPDGGCDERVDRSGIRSKSPSSRGIVWNAGRGLVPPPVRVEISRPPTSRVRDPWLPPTPCSSLPSPGWPRLDVFLRMLEQRFQASSVPSSSVRGARR